MTISGNLWTVDAQHSGKAIRAVAAIGGIIVNIPPQYTHFVDNKKPEYLAKFPLGKIPAWEGADGVRIFEGAAIARYLAALSPNSGLLGHSVEDAAHVDQWVHLGETEINIHTIQIQLLCKDVIPYNKRTYTFALERQERALAVLNDHLASRTFFVGERITLADIFIAAIIQKAVSVTIDAALRAKYPNIIRHLETIVNQPKLAAIFGETVYAEKMQFTPPPKEKAPKTVAPKVEKAEKKVVKKAAEDDDDEEDTLLPPEPKARNPLDDLPKSTFNLEDWKRAYSNKETRGPSGALEWFYENFDPAGFSLWRLDFKYNEELTMTFMSANQIGGFFNRLEASRKYLFGSVGVLGAASASVISGAFVLRGQDVRAVVECAPDWDSYDYKRLDLDNAEDKAFFEAALAWDLELDGKKWVDGKNFK